VVGAAGRRPAEGTYVSYDSDALLGVLALEAVRAGASSSGEDLGTVEPRVRTDLDAAGVLGSAVLWFERDEKTGEFLPPDQWRELALATGDHARPADRGGFLAEEHVRVRHELDQLGLPLEQEQARTREERAQLLDMLTRSGLLAATTATSCWRCTPRWPPRRRGWCWPPSATPSATCGSPTCRAPSTSTRTGGCRWPTARAARCCSSSCSPRPACAGSRA
jgi:4-alpha-glucanotransferase